MAVPRIIASNAEPRAASLALPDRPESLLGHAPRRIGLAIAVMLVGCLAATAWLLATGWIDDARAATAPLRTWEQAFGKEAP